MGFEELIVTIGFFLLVLLAVALLAVAILRIRLRVVPEEERLVIYRLGRFNRIGGPGLTPILERIETIHRTLNVREEPHDVRVNSLFLNGIPFGYTLDIWWRIDPKGAAKGNQDEMLRMVQFNDDERKHQAGVKVREALVASTSRIEKEYKPRDDDFFYKLLPLIPGIPECQRLLDYVRQELAHSLPSVGIMLNQNQPITITGLHLSEDIINSFSRGRITEMVREQFPDLAPELILQTVSAITGVEMPQQRVVLDGGGAGGNTAVDYRIEDEAKPRVKIYPQSGTEAAPQSRQQRAAAPVQPSVQPLAAGEGLTKEELGVLKRAPVYRGKREVAT